MTTTVQNGLTISETLLALHAWRWKIFAIVLLTVGLGVLHVTITPNIYRADALVQIVRQEPGRPQAREGDIRAVAAEFRKESNVFAETAVIQSRTLLGSVVEQLGLDLVVTPLRPARHQWSALVPSRLLSVLIKGPDRDHAHPHAPVAEFVVATTLLDEPFFLEFDEDGRATLKDAQGTPLGSGPASEPLVLETPDGTIHLAFDQEKVTPNTRYQVMRHSVVSAVDALKKRLKVAEHGEHSGVLRISLDGHDGGITREIVRTIVHTYDELHHQWTSHDIGEALSYLESQMPELAKRSQRAETAITIAQRTNYSLDIRDEGKRISDRVSELETEIGKERRKLDLYIPGHPEYAQIEATIARLNEEIHVLRTRLKQLPMLQERMKELVRKAGVTSELYAHLMKNVQELQIVKAAISNDIRIIDRGETLSEPVAPNTGFVLAFTLLLGVFGGSAGAIIRHLRRGISDNPDSIEHLLELPVYATLPYVPHQRSLERYRRPYTPGAPAVLALQAPTDTAIEGLRGLRTWFNTGDFRSTKKGLLITGPTQAVGKTFVSTNLAAVLAATDRRVLLIDADMRKGELEKVLKLDTAPGLADLLSDPTIDVREVIHSVGGFHCIAKGSCHELCSELLWNGRFRELLAYACANFDDVIIDSPPILAVSDAVLIGQMVGSALLVARAGVTTAAELLEAKKRLAQAEIPLKGVIFNGVTMGRWRYGYGYSYSYDHSAAR